ncbi:hypothetical protein BDV35DRAFT_120338 [Aspergillus flavus]|uniref:Uncharacterized protein n=1 Tax=Aspergillus flavus TaxID=5059 RepID=A0A5N6GH02_ASPFL|nr:hypothetical protein BDV35DRAFT_120338 [Aspergillus flavus]
MAFTADHIHEKFAVVEVQQINTAQCEQHWVITLSGSYKCTITITETGLQRIQAPTSQFFELFC